MYVCVSSLLALCMCIWYMYVSRCVVYMYMYVCVCCVLCVCYICCVYTCGGCVKVLCMYYGYAWSVCSVYVFIVCAHVHTCEFRSTAASTEGLPLVAFHTPIGTLCID